jgi:hypothetical protein
VISFVLPLVGRELFPLILRSVPVGIVDDYKTTGDVDAVKIAMLRKDHRKLETENQPLDVGSAHDQNHAKSHLSIHHARVGLLCSSERHRLDRRAYSL